MLRRRIEKLERLLPLGTSDPIERWERQAMAAPTSEQQLLVRAAFANGRRCNEPDSEAELGAMTYYERALADAIRQVSDAELDRIIESLGGEVTPEL